MAFGFQIWTLLLIVFEGLNQPKSFYNSVKISNYKQTLRNVCTAYQHSLHLQSCRIMEDLRVCSVLHLLVGHVPCVSGLADSVSTQNQAMHLCVTTAD